MADEISTKRQHELGDLGFAGLPSIISAAGRKASFRFIEFFTANIRIQTREFPTAARSANSASGARTVAFSSKN